MSESDWAATYAHQPGRIQGRVWWCEDEWCDCTQAKIERIEGAGPYVYTTLWEGEFHTDGETGARTELNREAQRLRRHHHDLYRMISWPWDRNATPHLKFLPTQTL